jgi:nitrile hydratase accessory protein
MSEEADPRIAAMEGDTALPRSNGELVFQAPWEGRAFGTAVVLSDRGTYPWTEFSEQLAKEIAVEGADASPETYYEHWVAALEQLLLDRGIVTTEEIELRHHEYESGARSDDWPGTPPD